MTTACYPCSDLPAASARTDGFDILRGAGLALSIGVIIILPAALAVLAWIHG